MDIILIIKLQINKNQIVQQQPLITMEFHVLIVPLQLHILIYNIEDVKYVEKINLMTHQFDNV